MAKGKKKIDTWTVYQDGEKADITVYLVRDPNDAMIGSTFRAECLDLDVRLSNTDIEALRSAAVAKVKKALTREFAEFLYIQFGGTSKLGAPIFEDRYEHCGDARADWEIEVQKILLTTDTSNDGPGGEVRRYKKMSPNGQASEWQRHIGRPKYSYGKPSALIPNTPENRAGLRRIFAGFAELNEQLNALLSADRIETNLQLLAAPGGRFLNAGPADPGKENNVVQ